MRRTAAKLPGGLAVALAAGIWLADAGTASAQTRPPGNQAPKATKSGGGNASKQAPVLGQGTRGKQPATFSGYRGTPAGQLRVLTNPRTFGPYSTPGLINPVIANPTLGVSGFGTLPAANIGFGNPGFGNPGFGTPGLGMPGFGYPTFGTPGFGYPTVGTPGFGVLGLGTPGFGLGSRYRAVSGVPFPSLSGQGPAYASPVDYYLARTNNANSYTNPLYSPYSLSPYSSPFASQYPFSSPFSSPYANPFSNPFSNPYANPYLAFPQQMYSMYPQQFPNYVTPSLYAQFSYPFAALPGMYPNSVPGFFAQPGRFGGFGGGSLGGGVSGYDTFGTTLPVGRFGY